jgi:hypothetical protein
MKHFRSEAIEKAVLNNPSEREIWKAAEEQGNFNDETRRHFKVLEQKSRQFQNLRESLILKLFDELDGR